VNETREMIVILSSGENFIFDIFSKIAVMLVPKSGRETVRKNIALVRLKLLCKCGNKAKNTQPMSNEVFSQKSFPKEGISFQMKVFLA
jgi:hypothetical protein